MALSIASSTITSSFTLGTDIGSDTQFSITAPSGIQEGEILFVIVVSERSNRPPTLPSGFTAYSLPNAHGSVKAGYKYATSGDESAGSYTFTIPSDDAAHALWAMYRITGGISSGNPVFYDDGFSFTANSTSKSQAVDVDIVTGGLLFVLISGEEVGLDSPPDFSSLVVTGPTVSTTERWDDKGNANAGNDIYSALYDGIPTTDGPVTNIAFSYDDPGDDDTIHVSVFSFYPQQDESNTLTIKTTANTSFDVSGQAGANNDLTIKTTENYSFDPTGAGYAPTKWTNTSKT